MNDHEKSLLYKGLNFSIPPKDINYADYLLPIELLYRDINSLRISNFDLDCIKARLRDSEFSSYKETSKFTKNNLTKAEFVALKFLIRNKELIIQKADKGNTVVLLNRKDYISKRKLILPDASKSKNIQIDESKVLNHLIHMENKIVELLKKLKEKQEISDKVYKELYPTVSRPGILYGLCKIHKSIVDGVRPFCIILSAIGIPTYKLANIFCTIIRTTNAQPMHHARVSFLIKLQASESFSFCEELKHFNTNLIMASFDVEILLTNVHLEETIDLCVQKISEDKNYFDDLSKDFFCEMLTVTTTKSFILFDNEYYRQHNGVAMGEKFPPKFRSVIYKRYVDDTFLLFHSINQIEKIEYYLNLQHTNIKFTSEIEMNNSLSFLGIKIVRENTKFTTSVYCKLTFSGVFTNFGCFIPNLYKYASMFTLLHRTFILCSNF